MSVLVKEVKNVTSEGVVLVLTEPAKLKTGNLKSKEIYVSWDKIGGALIDGYYDFPSGSVEHFRKVRGEP